MAELTPTPEGLKGLGDLVSFAGSPTSGSDGQPIYVKSGKKYTMDGKPIEQFVLYGRDIAGNQWTGEPQGINSGRISLLRTDNNHPNNEVMPSIPQSGDQVPWNAISSVTFVDGNGKPFSIPKEDLSLTKPEPKPLVEAKTETPAPAGESYPRYVDAAPVTREQLAADPHFQEVLTQARDVVRQIQALRKDIDIASVLPHIQQQIREVGRYSKPENAKDPAYQALLGGLTKHGLNHDEFLLATDYMLDEAHRAGNEQKMDAWSKQFQQKYGAEATRQSILDMVERGHEGSVHFSHDAVEMNMTAADRNAGYQDLRAMQLVSDRLLDTYNPAARTTWWQNGQLTAEGRTQYRQYQTVLSHMIGGTVPAEQRDLAAQLRTEYEAFKRLPVDQAVAQYKGTYPGDKDRLVTSVARWRQKHGVEPYRPGDLDMVLLKGLSLADRRADYPSDLAPTTDTFYRKALQEKPRGGSPTSESATPTPTPSEATTTQTPTAQREHSTVTTPPAYGESYQTSSDYTETPEQKSEVSNKISDKKPINTDARTYEEYAETTPTAESRESTPPPAEQKETVPINGPGYETSSYYEEVPEQKTPPQQPTPLTELRATVAASKAQMEKDTGKKDWFGRKIVRQTRELIEAKAAELAKLMMNEPRKKWEKKGAWQTVKTLSERIFRGMGAEMPQYIKEKRHAIKLFEATGLEGNVPYELFAEIDRIAHERLGDERKNKNIFARGLDSIRDFSSELVARERDIHRMRVTVANELRTQFDANPLDSANPLHQAIWGDYASQSELANRIGMTTLQDTLHVAMREKRTVDPVLLAKDSKPSQFINREILTPMIAHALNHDGPLDPKLEVELRTKLQEYWLTPEFQTWREGLPDAQRSQIDLSLSYASNIIDVGKDVLMPNVRLCRDHYRALDTYDFDVKLTLGTARFGPNGEIPSQSLGEKRLKLNKEAWDKLQKRAEASGKRQGLFGKDTVTTGTRTAYLMAYINEGVRTEWLGLAPVVLKSLTGSTLRATTGILASPAGKIAGALLPSAVGSAYIGTVQGIKEFVRLGSMRREHDMQEALGYERAHDAVRAAEMEALAYNKAEMGKRADSMQALIQSPLDQGKALMLLGLVADSDARTAIGDRRDINLWQVDKIAQGATPNSFLSQEYQGQQTALDAARAQAKLKLIDELTTNATLKSEIATALALPADTDPKAIIEELTAAQTKHLEEAVMTKIEYRLALGDFKLSDAEAVVNRDKAFDKFRLRRSLGHGVSMAGISFVGGVIASEGGHLIKTIADYNKTGVWELHGPISGAFETVRSAGPMTDQAIGNVKVHLPAGMKVANVTGGHNLDLVDSKGHVIAADVFTPNGTQAPDAVTKLAQAHIRLESNEIAGALSGTHTEIIGNKAFALPKGIDLVAGRGDRLHNDLRLPDGHIIHNVFKPDGSVNPAAQPELDKWGLHIGNPDIQHVSGNTPVNMANIHSETNVDRQGWWDNKTPTEFDASGHPINYHSEGNELSMHLGLTRDGHYVSISQDFEPPTGTSTQLEGMIQLRDSAAAGKLFAMATAIDSHGVAHQVNLGTLNANGQLFLDMNDPQTRELFHVVGGKLVPNIKFLEIMENRGGSLVAPASTQIFEQPEVTITTTNVGQEILHTLTPLGGQPGDAFPLPFGYHRPLEAPEGKKPTPSEGGGGLKYPNEYPVDYGEIPQPPHYYDDASSGTYAKGYESEDFQAYERKLYETLGMEYPTPQDLYGASYESRLQPLYEKLQLTYDANLPYPEQVTKLYEALKLQNESARHVGHRFIEQQKYLDRLKTAWTPASTNARVLRALQRLNGGKRSYYAELENLNKNLPAMHKDCQMSIVIPAYNEEQKIGQSIKGWIEQFQTESNTPLNPDSFEIIVFVNRPNAETPFDQTRQRVEELKRNPQYAPYHIHVVEKTFNISNQNQQVVLNGKTIDIPRGRRMGLIYGLATDLAVMRNMTRNSSNAMKANHILKTGGADAFARNPNYIDQTLQVFDKDPDIEQYNSRADYPPKIYEHVPLLHVTERFRETMNMQYTDRKTNLGLGVYRTALYAEAGGFNPDDEIAEEVRLNERMRKALLKRAAEQGKTRDDVIKRDVLLRAIDDPRRALAAVWQGIPMHNMYSDFWKNKVVRSMNVTEMLQKPVPAEAQLTPANLKLQLEPYVQYYTELNYLHNPDAAIRGNLQASVATAKKHAERSLAWLGFKKTDYDWKMEGDISRAKDVSNIKAAVKNLKIEFRSVRNIQKLTDAYKQREKPEWTVSAQATVQTKSENVAPNKAQVVAKPTVLPPQSKQSAVPTPHTPRLVPKAQPPTVSLESQIKVKKQPEDKLPKQQPEKPKPTLLPGAQKILNRLGQLPNFDPIYKGRMENLVNKLQLTASRGEQKAILDQLRDLTVEMEADFKTKRATPDQNQVDNAGKINIPIMQEWKRFDDRPLFTRLDDEKSPFHDLEVYPEQVPTQLGFLVQEFAAQFGVDPKKVKVGAQFESGQWNVIANPANNQEIKLSLKPNETHGFDVVDVASSGFWGAEMLINRGLTRDAILATLNKKLENVTVSKLSIRPDGTLVFAGKQK